MFTSRETGVRGTGSRRDACQRPRQPQRAGMRGATYVHHQVIRPAFALGRIYRAQPAGRLGTRTRNETLSKPARIQYDMMWNRVRV